MGKKKLIFHIGTSRTGTTSIQTSLLHNEIFLRNKGVFYAPEYFQQYMQGLRFKYGSYRWIAKDILKTSLEINIFFQRHMNQFLKSGCETMLISYEALFPNISNEASYTEMLINIKKLFIDFDVKIICYLRRQDFYLESWYNQLVKVEAYTGTASYMRSPHILSRDDAFSSDAYEFEQKEHIDAFDFFLRDYFSVTKYDVIISKWAEIFGKENIMILPFEKGQMQKGLIHSFYSNALNIADGEIETLVSFKPINESLCRDALEFKLASGIEERGFFECIGQLQNDKNMNFRFFTNTERKRFLSFHEPGNSFIAREYLGRKDDKLFYDEIEEYEPYPGLSLEKAKEIRKTAIPILKYGRPYDVSQVGKDTDNIDEIIESVKNEYFNHPDRNYIKTKMRIFFDTLLNGYDKTLVVYGAFGSLADTIFEAALPYGKCINMFVSDKALKGKLKYREYTVLSLDDIEALKPDVIIIAAKHSGEAIKKDLAKLDLPNTVICPAYDFGDDTWGRLLPTFTKFKHGGDIVALSIES